MAVVAMADVAVAEAATVMVAEATVVVAKAAEAMVVATVVVVAEGMVQETLEAMAVAMAAAEEVPGKLRLCQRRR